MIAIDLFCGIGGWAKPLMDLGYEVVGFDIRMFPQGYPGQLVLQDVRTIDGRRFRGARVIVASPPCEAFSRYGMPFAWPAKPRIADLDLVNEVWRIREESRVPTILENVRALQYFIGQAEVHYGGFYLWGDLPLLHPRMAFYKGIFRPRVNGRRQWAGHRAAHWRAKIPYDLGRWIGESFL